MDDQNSGPVSPLPSRTEDVLDRSRKPLRRGILLLGHTTGHLDEFYLESSFFRLKFRTHPSTDARPPSFRTKRNSFSYPVSYKGALGRQNLPRPRRKDRTMREGSVPVDDPLPTSVVPPRVRGTGQRRSPVWWSGSFSLSWTMSVSRIK